MSKPTSTVYIMVGNAVVSDSAGKPRVFTRKTARNYKRNQLTTHQRVRVVESIEGVRNFLRMN